MKVPISSAQECVGIYMKMHDFSDFSEKCHKSQLGVNSFCEVHQSKKSVSKKTLSK